MVRSAGPSGSKLRVAAAVLSLLVLAASLARSFEPSSHVLESARRLAAGLRGDPPLGRVSTSTGFGFDPEYAEFLEQIRAATPETATVAVLVPRRFDGYLFQAHYQLAPRRVVEEKWKEEASYVATYRSEAGRGPGGRAIAHGELWVR